MANWTMETGPAGWEAEQEERMAVWVKVRPADNWKNPIDAWIANDDLAECNEAAIWFAGSPLTVAGTRVVAGGQLEVRVVGDGYYVAIGA